MKGQTEVIGLVVIVFLLIFGGVIYLKLSSNKQTDYAEIRTNIKGANLLQAIVPLTINGTSFKEHLILCKEDQQCQALQQELPIILATTIPKNQHYQFTITNNNNRLINLGNCTTGIANNQPVITKGQVFDLQLKICPT